MIGPNTTISISALAVLVIKSATSHNCLSYHACCGSITKKGSKVKARSHLKRESLRSIVELDTSSKERLKEQLENFFGSKRVPINSMCSARNQRTPEEQCGVSLEKDR